MSAGVPRFFAVVGCWSFVAVGSIAAVAAERPPETTAGNAVSATAERSVAVEAAERQSSVAPTEAYFSTGSVGRRRYPGVATLKIAKTFVAG